MFRYIDHVLAQLVFCLVDTRGIEEDDLTVLTGVHGLDTVSGRLRLLGCDRDLLTDQMVQQCGLAAAIFSNEAHTLPFG